MDSCSGSPSGSTQLQVGCGWQAFAAYVNDGCYYVVGIPIGCILGFKFNFGVKGIWSGTIGGTVMQTLILLWVTSRTDWNKEVSLIKHIYLLVISHVLSEDEEGRVY